MALRYIRNATSQNLPIVESINKMTENRTTNEIEINSL